MFFLRYIVKLPHHPPPGGVLNWRQAPIPSNTHHGDTETRRNSKHGRNLGFYRLEGFLCASVVRFWFVNREFRTLPTAEKPEEIARVLIFKES